MPKKRGGPQEGRFFRSVIEIGPSSPLTTQAPCLRLFSGKLLERCSDDAEAQKHHRN